MSDFFVNLCKEHPLLEYIEDPFAENDNIGYRALKLALSESFSHIKIGLQNIFRDSRIEKVKEITKAKTQDQQDEEKMTTSSQQRPPTNEEKKKAPAGKVVEVVAEA